MILFLLRIVPGGSWLKRVRGAGKETLSSQFRHRRRWTGFHHQDDGFIYNAYFNADGSEAETCGNALRCFADYLLKRGLLSGPNIEVNTLGGGEEDLRRRRSVYGGYG